MTRPFPNTRAPLVDRNGIIQNPFNIWFQQFAQAPPPISEFTVTTSPYSVTINDFGTLVISGGTISDVSLTRGSITVSFGTLRSIPISFGDTVEITYSVLPVVQFIPG